MVERDVRFGSVSALLFLLRGFGAEFVAIGLGVASLIAAFGCCWQGARAFDRRPPLWLPVLAAPGIWLAACLLPDFIDTSAIASCCPRRCLRR